MNSGKAVTRKEFNTQFLTLENIKPHAYDPVLLIYRICLHTLIL